MIITFVAITIGFSRTAYTINENDGEFVLIVEVKSGTVTLKSKVLLNISTRDSSAVGKLALYLVLVIIVCMCCKNLHKLVFRRQ